MHSWNLLEIIMRTSPVASALAMRCSQVALSCRVNEERKPAKENSAVVNVLAIRRAYLTSLSIRTTKLKPIYN